MLRTWLRSNMNSGSIVCGGGIAPQWIQREQKGKRQYCGIFVLFGPGGAIVARLAGRVVEYPGLLVDVYVFDPPPVLRKHPHGRCLQLLRPGSRWYKLHWEKPARTFDEARAYVERLMDESLAH